MDDAYNIWTDSGLLDLLMDCAHENDLPIVQEQVDTALLLLKELRTFVDLERAYLGPQLNSAARDREKSTWSTTVSNLAQLDAVLGQMQLLFQDTRLAETIGHLARFQRLEASNRKDDRELPTIELQILERLDGDADILRRMLQRLKDLQSAVDEMHPDQQYRLFRRGTLDTAERVDRYARHTANAFRELLPFLLKDSIGSLKVPVIIRTANIFEILFKRDFAVTEITATARRKAEEHASKLEPPERVARYTVGHSLKFAMPLLKFLGLEEEFGTDVDCINSIGNTWDTIKKKKYKPLERYDAIVLDPSK